MEMLEERRQEEEEEEEGAQRVRGGMRTGGPSILTGRLVDCLARALRSQRETACLVPRGNPVSPGTRSRHWSGHSVSSQSALNAPVTLRPPN